MAEVQTHSLRTFQLISGAMVTFVVLFSVIVLFVGPAAPPGEDGNPLPLVLVSVAALLLVTHTIALRMLDKRVGAQLAARRAEALEEVQLAEVPRELAGRTLIAMAFGESIALLAPVIYLISRSPLAAAPLVVGLGWMLVHFPARDRLRSAVERAGRPSY
jgi:hypothetical protein